MKKILFVGVYPNILQENRNIFFRNLIYAMADKGEDCYVISPVSVTRYRRNISKIPKKEIQITPKGAKVHVFYPRCFSASSIDLKVFNTDVISEYLFEKCVISTALMLDIDFDAVYGHFFLQGGLAAIKVGRKLGIPSFVAYGECDYESQIKKLHGDLTKNQLKGLTGVISVSSKNTGDLKNTGLFDSIPIFLAVNAVDHSLLCKKDKEECRRKFGLPNDKFIVGVTGGFSHRKGQKRVLEACNQAEDVYMAFAGWGEDVPQGEKVLFAGEVKHDDINLFLSAVDVFVLPTLNEGCCNAILEAMATEKPIVSSALPFNDDILTEENSIKINPLSIEELKEAIIKLRDDTELREILSNKAKEDSKNFTIEKRAEKILDFMNEEMRNYAEEK